MTHPSDVPQTKISPLLVLPPLFLHVLSASLSATPLSQFLIMTVCESLGANVPPPSNSTLPLSLPGTAVGVDFPDYKTCASRVDVQTQAALWSQMISLASAIPAFLLVPLMGKLVDNIGRRRLMILPILATCVGALSVIVVAEYSLSLWVIVAVHGLQGFLGGYTVFSLCAYAFVGDTTPVAKRTQTFLFVDAFSYFALTVGPFTGGVMYRNFGILPVFYTVLCFECFVFLYVLLVLPESLKPKQGSASNSIQSSFFSPLALWRLFSSSWSGSLDVLAVPGRGASLFILAIVTSIGSMTFAGYAFAFYFYPAQMFGWDSYDAGIFSLINSVCRMFYLTILLPFLLRKLTEGSTNPVAKIRVELGLIRTGICAFAFGLILFGLAQQGWMFYVIICVYAFGTIAFPTVRGLVSRLVPTSSGGALFAALELLQSGSTLCAQFILPSVFRVTNSMGKPQTIYFVLSSLWISALICSARLKSRELVAIEDDVVTEEAPLLAAAAAADMRRGSSRDLRSVYHQDSEVVSSAQSYRRTRSVRSYGAMDDLEATSSSEEEEVEEVEVGGLAAFQKRMSLLLDPDLVEDAVEGIAQELQIE
ncbi:MFS general substrate transporter [Rhizoclosmatium globosum]|uniref:MFS general substrate transporter n=1 Tax=Rhizoclosmatium globosum TaxID=329046 RepID=A0A1Y2BN71_9FUNG|nr:MFS general substrate transporter [Rhizoclosmatium globosum]|eukprot:ORY36208.1 MFS general substrate transporter [Rhizoclosmatium globosum]